MKLPASQFAAFRETTRRGTDAKIARRLKTKHDDQLADTPLEDVTTEVRHARHAAEALGLEDRRLKIRFIMISVLRSPQFWEDPTCAEILHKGPDSPDARFERFCALMAWANEGRTDGGGVWWQA